jgi:hypothetical protein
MAQYTVDEFDLLIEGLERAARRHESMARFIPRFHARAHEARAAAMRKLQARLMREQIESPVFLQNDSL